VTPPAFSHSSWQFLCRHIAARRLGSSIVRRAQKLSGTLWSALLVATVGNTLGGMVSFGMGWLLPQTQQLKHVDKLRRYGTPVLLLAWVR